jgi:hypothetical protein
MDTGKPLFTVPNMKLLFRRRTLSRQRAAAGKTLAAGLALICALAMWSCDSQDPTNNGAATPARAPSAVETDGSAGDAVVIPQEELASEYATLLGLVAEASSAQVWQQFRAQQQAKLSVTANQLIVNATGDNPVIILPGFAANQRFIIEAVINSSNETSAQLYYLTPGQTKYTEDQSQIVQLKPGRNIVYFKIDDPNVIDPLRLDPASTPGTYTFERMTARGLPPDFSD